MVSANCEVIVPVSSADPSTSGGIYTFIVPNFETTGAEFLKKLWDGSKNKKIVAREFERHVPPSDSSDAVTVKSVTDYTSETVVKRLAKTH